MRQQAIHYFKTNTCHRTSARCLQTNLSPRISAGRTTYSLIFGWAQDNDNRPLHAPPLQLRSLFFLIEIQDVYSAISDFVELSFFFQSAHTRIFIYFDERVLRVLHKSSLSFTPQDRAYVRAFLANRLLFLWVRNRRPSLSCFERRPAAAARPTSSLPTASRGRRDRADLCSWLQQLRPVANGCLFFGAAFRHRDSRDSTRKRAPQELQGLSLSKHLNSRIIVGHAVFPTWMVPQLLPHAFIRSDFCSSPASLFCYAASPPSTLSTLYSRVLC